MWLMLQSKKQSRYGALKLLDFATTRYALPCDKLVDLGVLKHVFGVFMGKAKIKGPRGEREGVHWGAACALLISLSLRRRPVQFFSLRGLSLRLVSVLLQAEEMWRPKWRSAASPSSSTSFR